MRSMFVLPLAALLTTVAAADDKKPSVPPVKVVALTRPSPVVYEKDVEPILVNKCATCHSGSVKKGKFDVTSHETVLAGGKRGRAVVPGKAAESPLYRLAGKTEKPTMPPEGDEPLTPEELAVLKLWIDQGAKPPANAGPKARAAVVLGVPPAGVHPVRALAVGPDKAAVAAGRGNQIHLYDAATGKHLRTLTDPALKTADGKPVAAAHLSLVEALAYSPDGKTLASGGYGEVTLWDPQAGAPRRKLTGFAAAVVTLAFSPDGKLLATGGGPPTEDGEIKVFQVADGKQVLDVKNGHSDTVFGAAFSPDGKLLATCGADKFVKVFEVPSGKFVKSFEGHTHHVLDVGWKADGKLLASAGADNAVKIWDYEKGEQARTINAHQKQVTRLVFAGKTGQFATCSGDQMVKMWNVDNGGNTRNFGGGKDYLYALGVSPDGALVAAGGEEDIVRLYNGNNPGQAPKELLPPKK